MDHNYDSLFRKYHFQDYKLVGRAMYPIQYKRDGEIFQVDGLQLKSKGGKPKGKIRNWFKWPYFDLLWSQLTWKIFKIRSKTNVREFWINKSLKITVPSNSGYDDATERSNLEAMKKQSFSTYTLAPSLAAMDEGMFLDSLFWPQRTFITLNSPQPTLKMI